MYATLADTRLHHLFELWDLGNKGHLSFADVTLGLRRLCASAQKVYSTASDAAEVRRCPPAWHMVHLSRPPEHFSTRAQGALHAPAAGRGVELLRPPSLQPGLKPHAPKPAWGSQKAHTRLPGQVLLLYGTDGVPQLDRLQFAAFLGALCQGLGLAFQDVVDLLLVLAAVSPDAQDHMAALVRAHWPAALQIQGCLLAGGSPAPGLAEPACILAERHAAALMLAGLKTDHTACFTICWLALLAGYAMALSTLKVHAD